jgi:hypothetical protein
MPVPVYKSILLGRTGVKDDCPKNGPGYYSLTKLQNSLYSFVSLTEKAGVYYPRIVKVRINSIQTFCAGRQLLPGAMYFADKELRVGFPKHIQIVH